VTAGKKPATVKRYVATIARVHMAAGLLNPCSSEAVLPGGGLPPHPLKSQWQAGGWKSTRISAARARGRNGGRPKKLGPKELKTIRTLLRSNEVAVQDIAAQFKVNRSTLYRNVTAM
jgi:hypothetical protein